MRLVEIENWALTVIQQVENDQPNEDARVELKSDWIDHYKAARRLAGHANSARGDPILWLIGLDQESGPLGVDHNELASWLNQVFSHFDGIYPNIVDINIRYQDITIVALYIETDRAPFVVKNPNFGTTAGVVIASEIPWREGTSIRTATRSDLIRLLVPRLSLPEFEVLDCNLSLRKHDKYRWHLELQLYLIPQIGIPVVIPYHRCEVQIEITQPSITYDLARIRLVPPYKPITGVRGLGSEPDSLTAAHTQNELILEGPSRVNLSADTWAEEVPQFSDASIAEVRAKLSLIHANQNLSIIQVLRKAVDSEPNTVANWEI